jgi:hypothetical protein
MPKQGRGFIFPPSSLSIAGLVAEITAGCAGMDQPTGRRDHGQPRVRHKALPLRYRTFARLAQRKTPRISQRAAAQSRPYSERDASLRKNEPLY